MRTGRVEHPHNKIDNKMIIDIDARMVNGKLCLYKFDHKEPGFQPKIGDDGYVSNISIKDMSWQKIETGNELAEIVKSLDNSNSLITASIGRKELVVCTLARTKDKEEEGKVYFSWFADCRMSCNLDAVFGDSDE